MNCRAKRQVALTAATGGAVRVRCGAFSLNLLRPVGSKRNIISLGLGLRTCQALLIGGETTHSWAGLGQAPRNERKRCRVALVLRVVHSCGLGFGRCFQWIVGENLVTNLGKRHSSECHTLSVSLHSNHFDRLVSTTAPCQCPHP